MAYNEYEDYLDEIRRRKEAERFAIEQAEIDRDMRIKGFFLFAIFAGIVYFFVRHPKLIVFIILSHIVAILAGNLVGYAINSRYSVDVGGTMVNTREDPTYLPNLEIDRIECEERVNKAIKKGKVEILEDSFSSFPTGDKYEWLRLTPAYDILNIADTYMTKLRKDSLAANSNPYKVIVAGSLDYLKEKGYIPKDYSVSIKDRGYYIDPSTNTVYTWFSNSDKTLFSLAKYERARYIEGAYDEQFLKDWVTIVCEAEVDKYNNDMKWLMICKDSLRQYMEKRKNGETLINKFYSDKAQITDEAFAEIEKIDDGSITPTVEKLKEIVGENSYRDFLVDVLVNEPFCADQFPGEMHYYDHDITDWGDEYENAPVLKLMIAKYNAYDRLFPGEIGDEGVHPGNTEEEYQRILELREPLVNELNARIDIAFEEEPTRRWYDLIDEADLDELITRYDMTIMHNEKYYTAKREVNLKMASMSKKQSPVPYLVYFGLIVCTLIVCLILNLKEKKKFKEIVL